MPDDFISDWNPEEALNREMDLIANAGNPSQNGNPDLERAIFYTAETEHNPNFVEGSFGYPSDVPLNDGYDRYATDNAGLKSRLHDFLFSLYLAVPLYYGALKEKIRALKFKVNNGLEKLLQKPQ